MSKVKGLALAIGLASILSVVVVGQVTELQQWVIDVFEQAAAAAVHITVRGTAEDYDDQASSRA
jgi:hypothetical protein